jgi:PEP-CTERM motif
MRKAFLGIAVLALAVWSALPVMADVCGSVPGNLVTNCGFETGDFTGWTIGGNTSNPGGNYYGVDAFDANSGNFGAYMSQDAIDGGANPVTLSQTLNLAAGNYIVTFWLNQDTIPDGTTVHTFDAMFGSNDLLSLNYDATTPGTTGYTEYSYMVAGGGSTDLLFSFRNDDNYWSFDDVSVSAVPTPEPSSLMLLGSALVGLAGLRRRVR